MPCSLPTLLAAFGHCTNRHNVPNDRGVRCSIHLRQFGTASLLIIGRGCLIHCTIWHSVPTYQSHARQKAPGKSAPCILMPTKAPTCQGRPPHFLFHEFHLISLSTQPGDKAGVKRGLLLLMSGQQQTKRKGPLKIRDSVFLKTRRHYSPQD